MPDQPLGAPRWRLSMLADELSEPLEHLRLAVGARAAYVIYAPHGHPARVVMAIPDTAMVFMPDEPIRSDVPWSSIASTERHVVLRSMMRPVTVELDRTLVLPFTDGFGRGGVILSAAATTTTGVEFAQLTHFAQEMKRLRRQISATRHSDIDRAYRLVARAATSDLSLSRVFDLTLAAARNLTQGDVAYLSLPVDDEYFAFTQTLGITTTAFRDLRVGRGAGLGGAAREMGRPIRSLNYQEDSNLHAAPRSETRDEGIYSAMAVPVSEDGRVEAVLYVASREPRAFSEDDERVLADFANAALLGLDRSNLDESRQELVREQERTRIAQTLHDDLVRRLTQIGFAAEELQRSASDDGQLHAASITASVGECMALVRDELRSLMRDRTATESSLGEVADRIFAVPRMSAMDRRVVYPRTSSDQGSRLRVPSDVADAMCRIGQEAVFNAEHHSRGSECLMRFEAAQGMCMMSVSDDGAAFDLHRTDDGHFGLDFIRAEARRVGGDVEFARGPAGGLDVRVTFPIDAVGDR